MLSFFSLILVIIGSLNWLTIGVLQFDFIAGIFGSQSNIFSRLVYTLVGISAVVFVILLIKNKGKVRFSFKKATNEIKDLTEKNKATAESGADFSNKNQTNYKDNKYDELTEASKDNYRAGNKQSSREEYNNSPNPNSDNYKEKFEDDIKPTNYKTLNDFKGKYESDIDENNGPSKN